VFLPDFVLDALFKDEERDISFLVPFPLPFPR
jgi:hypothetical protein